MVNVTRSRQALAVKYFEQARMLLRSQGGIFLEIGRILKILRDEGLYGQLGEYQSWVAFLNEGGLGIRKSSAYAYIAIYETYVMRLGIHPDLLSDVPWDKLQLALPLARRAQTREEAEEAVVKARELSRSDLMLEAGERENSESGDRTRVVKVSRCEDCGGYRFLSEVKICECERR